MKISESVPTYLGKWVNTFSLEILALQKPLGFEEIMCTTDRFLKYGKKCVYVNPKYLCCDTRSNHAETDIVEILEEQPRYYRQFGNPVFSGATIQDALLNMEEELKSKDWLLWVSPEYDSEALPAYYHLHDDENGNRILTHKLIAS